MAVEPFNTTLLHTERGLSDDPVTENRKVALDLLDKINQTQKMYPTDQKGVTMTGGKAPIKIVGTIGNVTNGASVAALGAGITEVGQNANGYWTKTPTGTGVGLLKCWGTTARLTASDVYISPITVSPTATVTFPVAFLGNPTDVKSTVKASSTAQCWAGGCESITNTGMLVNIFSGNASGSALIDWSAEGFYTE